MKVLIDEEIVPNIDKEGQHNVREDKELES